MLKAAWRVHDGKQDLKQRTSQMAVRSLTVPCFMAHNVIMFETGKCFTAPAGREGTFSPLTHQRVQDRF